MKLSNITIKYKYYLFLIRIYHCILFIIFTKNNTLLTFEEVKY